MGRVGKKILFNIIYVVAVVGIVIAIWAVAATAIDDEFVLSSVPLTFSAFGTVFKNDKFWSALSGTMLRSSIGFFVSLGLFFVLFWLSTMFATFRRLAEPIISAMRSLPAVAITLILALAVGGEGAPIALGVIVIMPMMYSSGRARVATVPTELAEVCRICGAGRNRTFWALWFPALAGALPETLATGFSYNIKTVVGAEILAYTANSLGMLMKNAKDYLRTDLLIAFVIVAVLVSVVAEAVIRLALSLTLKKYRE